MKERKRETDREKVTVKENQTQSSGTRRNI